MHSTVNDFNNIFILSTRENIQALNNRCGKIDNQHSVSPFLSVSVNFSLDFSESTLDNNENMKYIWRYFTHNHELILIKFQKICRKFRSRKTFFEDEIFHRNHFQSIKSSLSSNRDAIQLILLANYLVISWWLMILGDKIFIDFSVKNQKIKKKIPKHV